MKQDRYPINEVFRMPPDKVLKAMMTLNIHGARSILELGMEYNRMDSQEFIDWQDELNAISITYKE